MADVFTPELTFGPAQSGIMTPTAPGAPYRTIQQGSTAFNPNSLSPSYYFDASSSTTRYQTGTRASPGSAASANNDPVGLLLDISSNQRDLSQATAGKRCLYQTASGLSWFLFDGVDDFLGSASFATSQPFYRISALRVLSLAATGRIFGEMTGANTPSLAYDATGALTMFSGVALTTAGGAVTVGTDIVVTEIHNGASSSVQIDSLAALSGDAGVATNFGFGLGGADFAATFYCNARVYGVFTSMGSIPSAPNQALLKTYFAALQGRVL